MKPEEEVRQSLIEMMTRDLGYPSSLLVVERALSLLPHLQGVKVPDRRLDLLCVEKGSMRPLLLVECKAKWMGGAFDQVFGYNEFVKAPSVGVVAKDKALFFWKEDKGYQMLRGFPTFEELCVRAQSKTFK